MHLSFAALVLAFGVPLIAEDAGANYTTEQIFKIETEEAAGFSRQEIDLGETGFSFSTLVKDGMDIWTGDAEAGKAIAKIYDPESRDALIIEVHRIEFSSFAEAPTAGFGFLARHGYDRIVQDKANSNAGFSYLAGGKVDENDNYSRMARVAAITHGRDVLVICAEFDYDDYPQMEEVVARFLGSIKMNETGAPADALRDVTASAGERFMVPSDFKLKTPDAHGKTPGRSEYSLVTEGQEYPNLFITIRPITLEKGRELGMKVIDQFTKQVEENPRSSFAGEPDMQVYESDSGEPIGYSYARGWDTDTGGYFVSDFMIQKNAAADSTSIIGLNTYDVRRGIELFDEETKDIIFKGWVTGVSAYSAAQTSLKEGADRYVGDLNIRTLGH